MVEFVLAVDGPGLQALRHKFRVTAKSDTSAPRVMDFTRTQQLGDLFATPLAPDGYSAP